MIWWVKTDIGRPVTGLLLMISCELISEGGAVGRREGRAERARGSLSSPVLQILSVVFFNTSSREEG